MEKEYKPGEPWKLFRVTLDTVHGKKSWHVVAKDEAHASLGVILNEKPTLQTPEGEVKEIPMDKRRILK